ncbi:Hydroperoxy fatty acid reductase gpx1 [compost metagenome]
MSIYEYTATSLRGETVDLSRYRGKVLLIVNTASKCGFTPQFQGLQELYNELQEQGLEILGFPSNQFANQEPGSSDDIQEFCQINYGVTFPMFEKIKVNGDEAHPLFRHLASAAPGLLGSKSVKWNFTKFLVQKDGTVFKRYAPNTSPADIIPDIRQLLEQT